MSASAHLCFFMLGLFGRRTARYLHSLVQKEGVCFKRPVAILRANGEVRVQLKWGVLHEAALVSQVSAGVDLEKGTAEERTTSGGALLAPCRDGKGKRMGRFISDSRFEAGWSRRRKGDSKSAMEER